MSVKSSLGIAVGAALALGLARASASDDDQALDEHIALFSELCLSKFPDDLAVSQAAKDGAMVPMTSDQVKKVLHDDPGIGWTLRTEANPFGYVITIEAPPFHACAIRRLYDVLPNFETSFDSAVTNWVADGNIGALAPPNRQSTTVNGVNIDIALRTLARTKDPDEVLMWLVTHFRLNLLELRFVRQIPPAH